MRNSLLRLKNEMNKNKNQKWLHSPAALTDGHIVYLVKFLGVCEVSEPKGLEIIKEAVQKLRFNEHIKKSEGTKVLKVELTISVDGITVQKPKSKEVMHEYPLFKISFCADDKADKKFFSFIARGEDGIHRCFVFISDKLSEEITLTIGQAFDLSYKKFINIASRKIDKNTDAAFLLEKLEDARLKNKLLVENLQKAFKCTDIRQLTDLEKECQISKLLIEDDTSSILSASTDSSSERGNSTRIMNEAPPVPPRNPPMDEQIIKNYLTDLPNIEDDNDFDPRAEERSGGVGCLNDDDDFNPRAMENKLSSKTSSLCSSALIPPPPGKSQRINDPFEVTAPITHTESSQMVIFNTASFKKDEDFTLDDLDPLKK